MIAESVVTDFQDDFVVDVGPDISGSVRERMTCFKVLPSIGAINAFHLGTPVLFPFRRV